MAHRHLSHVFRAKIKGGQEKAGDDVKEMKWFTLEEIKELDLTHLTLKTFNELYFSKE